MRGFIEEFKTFISRGNVVELAIAVVVGGAFGKIISSLVENIITPLIGLVLGGISVSDLMYKVGESEVTYGIFLQSVIDFLIIAFAIFVFINFLNRVDDVFDGDEDEAPAVPKEPPEDIKLLREIRDSLKK